MNNLLSDFLNDRVADVPLGSITNEVMECDIGHDNNASSTEEDEADSDAEEYVKQEMRTYHLHPIRNRVDRLCDIENGTEGSVMDSDYTEHLQVPKVFSLYKFNTYYKSPLLIDSFKNKILGMLRTNMVIIIDGPTGCGKTTQVPQFIMDDCRERREPCNIVVTQPRRIAAISISQRVCQERGWTLGTVCGYQVGLDRNTSDDVILTYMTTEVLLQKLITQRNLNKFTHVIIDEVHERNKTLDFLLLIVRKYLFTNSLSVKVILMSATMEAEQLAYYFRGISRSNPNDYITAPVLNISKKRTYTTDIYYNENIYKCNDNYEIDDCYLHQEQIDNCLYLLNVFNELDNVDIVSGVKIIGSVLIFLPGIHEIENIHKALNQTKPSTPYEIIPLHSSLSGDNMIRIFDKPKAGMRKVILSTNIAESSVTVPDVTYVIDFCLTKVMTMNGITKFSSLSMQWASHNNCDQRAGRTGRVCNGRVYRLVPSDFYTSNMPKNLVPEIQRAPLENIVLYMKLLDLNDTPKNILSLAISPPNMNDLEHCIWHLKEVGALLLKARGTETKNDGDLTFMGRVMGNLPIDIHLTKMIILGYMFSCLEETVIMAAGCMTSKIFVNTYRERFLCYRKKLLWSDGSCSDFLILLNLYNVWLKMRRENRFKSTREEAAWCKMNFISLKGLREWELLIKEINMRLKRMFIEKNFDAPRVHLSQVDKIMFLKVIICGAFYPNYFTRSSDFGQVDTHEAVKLLNGRDPLNTIYFSNMKQNHPNQIYVRKIKKLVDAENNPHVHVGFDGQSSKVFIEYKYNKSPEPVNINGDQVLTILPNTIPAEVYEGVRKRQLNTPFMLEILPDHQAWEFANSQTKKERRESVSSMEALNCFTETDYQPIPNLDVEYMSVIVTHAIDPSHFYCQHWNEETRKLTERIFKCMNDPRRFLEPVPRGEKIEINVIKYAAVFREDSKVYRCKVLHITPGQSHSVQVQFVDYGNLQVVKVGDLMKLPQVPESFITPIAMRCALSGIKPMISLPHGRYIWKEAINKLFALKTNDILLNARIYSVVDDVVRLEFYPQNSSPNNMSLNEWLVQNGHALQAPEPYLSKLDHERRIQCLRLTRTSDVSVFKAQSSFNQSYADFEEPKQSQTTEIIKLNGPFSPLEMKVCGILRATSGASIKLDGDSVNAVLLDDNPDDPHARLLVAAQVMQAGETVKLSQTTVMPSLPGFAMLMTLLFCPQMEPKLTEDGSRVASILCGLGFSGHKERANYGSHDISFVLDTELDDGIISKVNGIRYYMSTAVKTMSDIYDHMAYSQEFSDTQKELNEKLLMLLHLNLNSVEKINVQYAEQWNRNLFTDAEILRVDMNQDDSDIWPLLWFVTLKNDKDHSLIVKKNLEELSQIAKRLIEEKEIICALCKSETMTSISDVRNHLITDTHMNNLKAHDRYLKMSME